MVVPPSATLLASPAGSAANDHPPMFVRLTTEALESLKNKTAGRILLKVDGRSGALSVNGTSIDISVADEPGTLQVYTPCSKDPTKFQNVGLVTKRLTLRKSVSPGAVSPPTAAPTPQPASATSTALKRRLPRPAAKPVSLSHKIPSPPRSPRELLAEAPLLSSAMRVAHLLALGPAAPMSISQRTQVPVGEVQMLVQQIARPATPGSAGVQDLFILRNESYEHLKIFEWKQYSTKERQQVCADAQKAYAALSYPANHAARSNLKDNRRRTTSVSPERRALKRKSASAAPAAPPPAAPATVTPTPPTSASPPSTSAAGQAAKPPPEKRVKTTPAALTTTEEDLHTLARKFKATYSEYSRLYGLLSSGPRPESQVKKLLTMHRNLESWKQRLWSASKNRRGSQVPSK